MANRINIVIDSEFNDKGAKEASRSVDDLGRNSDASSRSMGSLGGIGSAAMTAIAAAAVAAIAGVGLIGANAIKSAGEYEQSRLAFETMLGSADKARGLLGDIAKFAKSTPFELPEVVSGTKQLLAFGFAQEDLLPTMRKLGDLSAGLGVPIGQLTNVFGQVRVAGRLMGQDLLQFTNAGVPLIEALANTMHKPQSEIKKLVEAGEIDFPKVEAALNSLTGEGSKFGGMMEKQSHSFNGVVSNIKDGFGQMLRAAAGITAEGDIIKGSFFDKIKQGAESLMQAMSKVDMSVVAKNLADVATAIGAIGGWVAAAIGFIVGKFIELRKDAQPLVDMFNQYLLPVLKDFAALLVSSVQFAITSVSNAMQQIQSVLEAAGIKIDVVKVILVALAAPLIALVTIIGLVVAAVAILVTAIATVIGWIANLIGWVVNVTGQFANFVSTVGRVAGGLWNQAAGGFNSFLSNAVNWARNVVDSIVQAFTSLPARLSEKIRGAVSGATAGLGNVLQGLKIPGFASGTSYAPGGVAMVGENGPELVNLPRGSQVSSSWQTKTAMVEQNSGSSITVHGDIVLQDSSAVQEFFKRTDEAQRFARMGLA